MKAVLPFAPPASVSPENDALADAPPAVVAVVASAAPDAGAPSRAILAAALLRIEAERKNGKAARLRTVMAWSGWAAAAGLAVWLGTGGDLWFSDSAHSRGGGGLGRNPVVDNVGGNGAPGAIFPTTGSPGVNPADGLPFPRERRGPTRGTGKSHSTSVAAVQDMEQLRADLEKLRSTNEARFLSSPGLSRTVVVEMTDPANPREAERLGAMRLSERVAESIAAGVTGAAEEKPADPPAKADDGGKKDGSAPDTDSPEPKPPEKPEEPKQDLVLSGGDGSWSGDVVIEKGLPNTGVLTLPEGAQIRHLNFPVDDATNYRGLLDLGAGYYYDQYSDLLWKPTGQGRAYTGEKAPAGFDAESFVPPGGCSTPAPEPETPAQPDISIPAETATPLDSNTATAPPDSTIPTTGQNPAAESVTAPPVRGYPIFDETTGSGSIILQNLPAAADGESYQLWITDPSSPQPVSVGIIPSLEEGGGRVWFDLGGPGVAPSGYLLTLEPRAGSKSPTGRVVLHGP